MIQSKQENLERMEKFFKYNLNIKQILHQVVPKKENKYNQDYLIEYSDQLEKALNDIEYYLSSILEKFNFPDNDKRYFNQFIKALKQELINIGYDFNKLNNFYETFFSNMNEDLVNEVGENCFGYSLQGGVTLSKAKSINELLHIVHQTIVNNENNLNSLPKLGQKINIDEWPITLYGTNNEIANKIFNDFPLQLSCGYTDIVSLSNGNVIMMVRDRGHALSIEIEKENNKYYVKYFIPKICNVDMVNDLKGVRKVTDKSNFTTGIFECDINSLSFNLFEFINKVPTDSDMVYENVEKIM